MSVRIYIDHPKGHVAPVDITEGVKTLFDHVLSSMDWGSGFLSQEETENVLRVGVACGFDVLALAPPGHAGVLTYIGWRETLRKVGALPPGEKVTGYSPNYHPQPHIDEHEVYADDLDQGYTFSGYSRTEVFRTREEAQAELDERVAEAARYREKIYGR